MFEKNKDISTEMKQLKRILKSIPKDRQPIAQNIYNELLFIQRTLDKLKKDVDEEGTTTLFKQGQQEFLRENPALKGYNTTIKNYSSLYRQLIDLLPPLEPVQEVDPLLDFIKAQ
ncbi:hypothetical protein FDE76_12375 [Clostridium botulinum]|uniref:Uncharacterized protein n=1 Tax=Clostridium botulinum (strain Eklund 17B / Type B) TaxID=935198 RepID=B2THE6_CLOBB|nr:MULTISPECIES: hypothetical protein [Clostridium]ACD22059.1 conserved hypothetical protein [Clostridium botulinum B str. Eklund 17B (NRP)]MBY6977419.1 hypothetical protein [Clostridium botulinum]MBY7001974.1 hypothetical protein [Clostridium botulinum]MCR1275579.1 hypothetical protein [Clostridium botulinum]MCS6131410.1 hypothetical protein [Clostridium botulinum]